MFRFVLPQHFLLYMFVRFIMTKKGLTEATDVKGKYEAC